MILGRTDFAGDWQIDRAITDRRTGQPGRFVGRAVLTPVGQTGLAYAETGQLQIGPGPPMASTRRYVWAFGDAVQVAFDDGRPFHSFRPGISGAGTDHQCGADLYQVTYGFHDWPCWTARWAVQGPRKDYVMLSRYWR